MFKFPGGFKRKIRWQKWQGTTLQNVKENPPAINNWKHTKHRLPILFYISSTEVKYKLYRYILKRVKIKPRNVFTKTVNFSCYFKLFSISVKHLFRCQRNQSYCKLYFYRPHKAFQLFPEAPFKWRKVVPAASTSASCVYLRKTLTLLPEQTRRSRMLWLSKTALAHSLIFSPWSTGPGWANQSVIWGKVGQARRVPSKKGHPPRLVTLLAEPTFCFSC